MLHVVLRLWPFEESRADKGGGEVLAFADPVGAESVVLAVYGLDGFVVAAEGGKLQFFLIRVAVHAAKGLLILASIDGTSKEMFLRNLSCFFLPTLSVSLSFHATCSSLPLRLPVAYFL